MKNKKVLALLVSLVLIVAVALPGTLAVSSDQDAVNSDFTVDTMTPAPETQELTDGQEQPEQPVVPETQKLTGEPETPEQPTEPVLTCTCDPKPAEGEAHKEGCPLYVAPEKSAAPSHIDTCSDDCTDAECKCACHLFDRLMACRTLDEIWVLLDAASEDALNALTDEQCTQIDAKIEALEPSPAPAIVIEESEPPVPSEIGYAMINYTNVAPLGDPITGQHQ